MDSHQQLMDTLTAHISLYSSSTATTTTTSNPKRTTILRWFTSLSIPQRQSHLTIHSLPFSTLLLDILTHVQSNGPSRFILLPDLPSSQTNLPTLCFRRSKGLLSRISSSHKSQRFLHQSLRLFGSIHETRLDSVTITEEFVTDVDKFVAAMDELSNGRFLRGEESGLGGGDWEELGWLKKKGYYTLEEFVANKLECVLRLAWLNCNNGGGKRRGVGKMIKEKANVAGIANNVFWRKKGCLDWWDGLDSGMRVRIIQTVLGKGAKSMTKEILKSNTRFLVGEKWLSGTGERPQLRYACTSYSQSNSLKVSVTDVEFSSSIIPASGRSVCISNALNSLLVLQEISATILTFQRSEYQKDELFFSSLGSVNTITDFILRRVRALLMIVSSDCVKLELLAGDNLKSLTNKSSVKLDGGSRRGKSKGRNLKKKNSVPKPSGAHYALEKPLKDHGCRSVSKQTTDISKTNGVADTVQVNDLHEETSLSRIEMEHPKGLGDGKVQSIGKSKKGTVRSELTSGVGRVTVDNPKAKTTQATTQSVSFESDSGKADGMNDGSDAQNLSSDHSSGIDSMEKNTFCDSVHECNKEDNDKLVKSIQAESISGSAEGSGRLGCCTHTSREKSSDCVSNSKTSLPVVPVLESDKLVKSIQVESIAGSAEGSGCLGCCTNTSREESSDCVLNSKTPPLVVPIPYSDSVIVEKELKHQNSKQLSDSTSQPFDSPILFKTVVDSDKASSVFRGPECGNYNSHGPTSSFASTSYEWPSTARVNVPFFNSQHLPAATDRLHLDVGRNWRNHFHPSFVSTRHQTMNPAIEGGHNRLVPQTLTMSLDWPPMVRTASRLTPSITCNYDTGFIPRLQPSFRQGFTPHGIQRNGTADEDRKYSGDAVDSDLPNAPEVTDDNETHWISEEEFEVHPFSGRDYNQFFGGGVMYWNTSDPAGPGFSRPPSLSSEDSSWAWHEADLNRAIDDMVGFPSSYSSNGLTSPPAGSFCSPFDPLRPGHQTLGYVMPGNDVTSKVLHSSSKQIDGFPEENVSGSLPNPSNSVVEGKNADSLPYPILRPIIIPSMSRKGSRSEFKLSQDHKSPCVPLTRREQPRIKRPPSPVVLCVPRAPCPLPPSPVGESRKKRGFPTVRSGSSSPRHWGLRSWYHDGTSSEEAGLRVDSAEVIWPSWTTKGITPTPLIHPLPGALLQDRLLAISQLALDQEHPDVALPLQPPDLLNCPARKGSLSLMHSLLHDEIDSFCKRVAAKNFIRKPYINWAVKRVARSLQVLWPRSRTNIFGSNATGLSLPTSDVDLVVCLPPVRNLEPIKEAGILEGRNGIKETCLQHAARYLVNQEWVKNDSLKTVENTAIPIIMLVAEVPQDLIISSENVSKEQTLKMDSVQINSEESSSDHSDLVILDSSSWQNCQEVKNEENMDIKSVCLDISFKSPSHTGLQTTELVRELTEQFPAATPLALVLKQFLADRSLDHSYSGGLSSYCLVLLITRFLQHEHHLGRPTNQNLGSLLMDFLYFFGNVFDPRQMRVSIQGSGVYVNRERGQSIDPIHIDDPLFPMNNVGRNCFRIHQCIKAFADAYSILESELTRLSSNSDSSATLPYRLLPKVVPSIDLV